MKRTTQFVKPIGTAEFRPKGGEPVSIPVVPGLLKHLRAEELAAQLADPAVARKYTMEALRVAPWPVLRLFPLDWLLACMPDARLTEGRRRALAFTLKAPGQAPAP